jgi:membrane fusion protein, multidrug efflux system
MNKFQIIGGICLLAGSALLWSYCTSKVEASNVQPSEKVVISTETLVLRDTLLKREYVTAIQAVRNVEIRSHLKGFLEEIYIDEGRLVRKGQLLFRLNDQELRAEMGKARAAIAIAEADVRTMNMECDRIRLLVDKQVVSESELSLAEAKLGAAQARVQEAKAAAEHIAVRLEYTKIKAPFDGVIDRIPLKVGSLVEEGVLLTTLSDVEQMYGYFEVSENEYLAISKAARSEQNPEGTPVELVLSDGSIYPYTGKIETMTGEFGQSTGSIAFRAKFANPGRLLKHGATGKIIITKQQQNVLMVPQKAVFEVQDKNYVYIIGNDNLARIRPFTPKMRLADCYIVAEGLQAGERIAAEGTQYLRDGMPVQVK